MGEGSEEGRDCVHCEISKKNMARVERKGRGRTGGASRGRIDDEPSRGGKGASSSYLPLKDPADPTS